jgi:hypothetical protein
MSKKSGMSNRLINDDTPQPERNHVGCDPGFKRHQKSRNDLYDEFVQPFSPRSLRTV